MPKTNGTSINFSKLENAERLVHFSKQFVKTEDVKKVISRCDSLWRQAGIMSEGDGAFILGETGAGKSTAVKLFVNSIFEQLKSKRPKADWIRPDVPGTPIRPIWEKRPDNGFQRPIAVVVVNPRPRFNSLMQDTALALGVKLEKKFNFGEAMRAIEQQVALQGIKMIIFDEVQHIVESSMNSYEAADVLKIVCKSRVQVVCVGLPSAVGIGMINAQMHRLSKKRHTIKPLMCSLADFPGFDATDGSSSSDRMPANAEFRRFCRTLDGKGAPRTLPFDKPSNLSDPQMALRLYRASSGYVGLLMGLLFQATDMALEKGLSSLTMSSLAEAYEEQTECSDDANWFKMGWPKFEERFNAPSKSKEPADYEEKVFKNLKTQRKRVENLLAGRA